MIPENFLSSNGVTNIHTKEWPVENPKAILQIVHGMSEYIERYDELARYLNGFGIYVVGHTNIGHYLTSPREDYGYFGPKDGWKHLVQDVEKMRQLAKANLPDVPYFVMGHSMGSFIARAWTKDYQAKDVDGVIYMGSSGLTPMAYVGKVLVGPIAFFQGTDRNRSKFINILAFGAYFKHIKKPKTVNDWLTRDEEAIKVYRADPNTGFSFTVGGYRDLIGVLTYVTGMKWARDIPKDLPILFLSGDEDPVGQFGKGPVEVVRNLEKAGCSDVSLILYEGMRHEIFNEFGKETVMEDLKDFILDIE